MRDEKIINIMLKFCSDENIEQADYSLKLLDMLNDDGINFLDEFIKCNDYEFLETYKNRESERHVSYSLWGSIDEGKYVNLSIEITGGEDYHGRDNRGWSVLHEELFLPLDHFIKKELR